MDMLENILSQEVVQKLGWTLLHSLWQGGIVVLLLAVLLRVLQKSSANLRYVISCLGLAVIVLLPVVTFYVIPAPALTSDVESVPGLSVPVTGQLQEVYDADMPLQRAEEYMQMSPAASWRQRAKNFCTSALPYIVFGWFIGVFALSLWHLGGWAHLQRLKRKNINQVDASLKDKLGNLAERLKVTRPVKLMKSALVQIPTVVGCLRPVILLPASALTGLSSGQLEAVLAHELAHIHRYDYLVNMLQTVVEIVGFYHPAVWWISHKMRIERENCCDDLAVSVCGDKVGYARALTSMEEIRLAQGELVIAVSGGNLFTRISRLVGNESAGKARPGWAPVVLSALLIIALAIPTTLALTAADSGSGLRADSTTVHVSELVDEENINSSVAAQPASHLHGTDTKTQILFDCTIYELSADLEIIEGKQEEKPLMGRIVWLGNEYAERLESLCRMTKKAKKLANPRILVLEGEEASMVIGNEIPYKAGYESTTAVGTGPKPIVKYAFDGIELKLKGHTVDSSTIRTELRLTQSKTSLTTHKDDQEREIQFPVVASSACATDVTVPSQIPVVIGGLKSQNNDNSQLFFVITPSIVRPESQVAIAKERRTIDDDPVHVVEFPDAEKEKIKADQRLAVLSVVLDDERLDAEKAVIQAEINALEAQLIELRKNYEADIFNRESEWFAEKRAFTADVVAAETRLVDTNSMLETDLATLEQMQQEIEIFTIENGAILGTDIVLYNQLQTMKANRDRLAEKIERDKGVLAKYQDELKAAEERKDKYRKFKPTAGTKDEDAQHIINMAKKALERRKAELKGLSTVLASAKEPESEHERLAVMATKSAERGDFAKAAEYQEKAIELAKTRKYYGIGIAIEKKDGLIRISAVLPNTPASGSSFQQGDIIEAVDGVSTEGMSLDDVVAGIVGPKGTEVTLSVKSHSQDVTEKKTFTRQLLLEGSQVLRAYEWRLAAYKAGKTWPQYRRMMEKPEAQTAGAPRIFELRYASAEELAEVLSRILERRWKGIKDKPANVVRIIPDPDTNRLIVLAGPADIQLIEALIAELDVLAEQDSISLRITPRIKPKSDTPAESTVTEIIALKYADCESTEEKLMILFSDEQFRIVSDKRTNTLIVVATKSTIQKILSLVAELDVPSREDTTATKISPSSKLTPDTPANIIYQIIQLQYSDCESVSEKVAKILSADQQFTIVPYKHRNRLLMIGTESAIQQIKALVTELDVPGPDTDREVLDINKQEKVDSDLTPIKLD